jgi:hypothetical protein
MNAILREQNRGELAELCQTSVLEINYITRISAGCGAANELSGHRRLA